MTGQTVNADVARKAAEELEAKIREVERTNQMDRTTYFFMLWIWRAGSKKSLMKYFKTYLPLPDYDQIAMDAACALAND